jgi:type VI secretion system protein VasD
VGKQATIIRIGTSTKLRTVNSKRIQQRGVGSMRERATPCAGAAYPGEKRIQSNAGIQETAQENRMTPTHRCALLMLALTFTAALAGCGNAPHGSFANAALGAVGLRKAAGLPESQQPPRNVPLRLHAATRLNVNERGQPLALAVRLYKLRQKDAFEEAPYAAFLDPQQERERLGADLVDVREIMLVPGQRYEVTEKVAREAGHVGIVALFHNPAAGHWRTTVSSADAERNGVNIGLHACAMSVAGGAVSGASMLGSVRCQ